MVQTISTVIKWEPIFWWATKSKNQCWWENEAQNAVEIRYSFHFIQNERNHATRRCIYCPKYVPNHQLHRGQCTFRFIASQSAHPIWYHHGLQQQEDPHNKSQNGQNNTFSFRIKKGGDSSDNEHSLYREHRKWRNKTQIAIYLVIIISELLQNAVNNKIVKS